MKLSGSPEEVVARAKELALLKEESATANGGPELLGLRVCADKSLAETPTEGRDEWRGVLLSAWAWTQPKGDAGRAHDLEMRFDKLSDEAEKARAGTGLLVCFASLVACRLAVTSWRCSTLAGRARSSPSS